MNRLLIIAAGGTIDAAEYNFETGSVISFASPAARHICERTMPDAVSRNIELSCPFQKDSDVMTEQDRQEILAICSRSPCTQIIITHGTGTMIDAGRLLAENLKEKTVVLTGSLPYAHDPATKLVHGSTKLVHGRNPGDTVAIASPVQHAVLI